MRILIIFMCVVSCITAKGTTYYISSDGNDLNSGISPSAPWKTISKLNKTSFLPGDIILFRRGDMWREQLNVPTSGTSGKPIKYGAYGTGAKPIINGADITKGWINAPQINANIWRIANPNATRTRAMVVIDDVIYKEVSTAAQLNKPNTYFINKSLAVPEIYVYSTVNPDNRKAEISKRDYGIRAQSYKQIRYINFVNLEVRYAGTHGLTLEGPVSGGFCVVDSCDFYANRATGCDAHDQHTHDIFKNSTATYNGNGFYAWISDNLIVSNCRSEHNISYANISLFTDGHAYGNYKGNNWLVEKCYSNDDADAIHIDPAGLPVNATIRYNRVFNSQGGVPNTPGMGIGSVGSGGTVKIYYNLIVNCASSGFESYDVSNGKVMFYNNTILLNDKNGINGGVYITYGSNFIFKNNIVVRDYVKDNTIFAVLRAGLPSSDHNVYYFLKSPSNTLRMFYNGVFYNSLAQWTEATGQDKSSMCTDPLFQDVFNNWSLKNGSPCINKGADVGLTTDINGNPIVGLPDIGAFEHVETAAKVNAPPIADAGNDTLISLPAETVVLRGNKSSDPDGEIMSYSWLQVSGPAVTVLNNDSMVATINDPAPGTYIFRLRVTDNGGLTDEDSVKIEVIEKVAPTNKPPVASAGKDIFVQLPSGSITLSGVGSYDPDGIISAFRWEKIAGSESTLVNAEAPLCVITDLKEGIHTFRLHVTDNSGDTASDDVQIFVTKNEETRDSVLTRLTIYPNPATGILKVRLPDDSAGNVRIVIHDLHGKVVGMPVIINDPGINEKSIDIALLRNGVYVVETTSSKGRNVSSFIKL